ncbi:putative pentatricopeptide repeat-containing protein at5g06400 mitochondrial [Phtheirospermum japonicum]|uniref:Putative pentatricopeptide repeat-containing protein at5g06400 mitochondrial n=1 Tax=Phtheirospermum japonicum TaxID=374723 RepID=A0A830B6N9_9LAMI|nr:putative pentatricopeptide repeat-containing protein at5g06400 mitochondrial [Phtheirospermum japonicum]
MQRRAPCPICKFKNEFISETMRYLFMSGLVNSNSGHISLNSHFLTPRVVHLVYLSTLSSKSPQNPKKTDNSTSLNNPRELQGLTPLFNEILGILGTENIKVDKGTPYDFLMSKETQLKGNISSVVSSPGHQQGVCGNADEITIPVKMKNVSGSENNGTVIDYIELKDVHPIVRKVTEIVRSINDIISMEEKLENAGFIYNEEVVENVLKNCFKVPHSAFRFFNWVKFKKGFRHTTDTYNLMMNVAGEGKDFALVEELSSEMEKNNCGKNIKTWTILVSHYGKSKLIGKALLTFDEMKRAGFEPDSVVYRTMIRSLCDAGKADLALEFYKDTVINEVNLDLGSYKNLLKCFALSGNFDAVNLVGENMMSLSEIPETHVYGLMLKSFCIAGRIKESLELIRDLKGKNIVLDAGIFETLVKGLCSKDRITDAMEILEIMKKKDIFDENIYRILISTYLRRNEVSEAFDLFREAKKHGNISVSTYTNLMQHLFWKNEFEKGFQLFNEMLETGVQLDSVAITAVAAGYARQNRASEAWKVFESMDEKGIKPTSKSYTILINELCKVSKTDQIVKALTGMQVRKVNIRDDVFGQVVSYLEKQGEIEKRNAVMQIPRGSTSYPRGRDRDREKQNAGQCNQPEPVRKSEPNQLVAQERLYENRDIKEVCQILSSLTDWCEKLEKLNFQFTPDLVVEILRNCGPNIGTALNFFSWVGKQTGFSHNERSYNMALKIAGQGKNFKQMRSLFYEMSRRGCLITSDTWTIMIMQYGRTGLTDIALSNFREMKNSGCKPTKSTYSSLITSLCGKKGRKIDEAIEIYQEMVRTGWGPDKELVETYVGCLCEANKLAEAKNCIESLHKFGYSVPLSYSLYFRALCRAGKLEDALALMDEIGSERNILDQYTYGSLIHCLLRRGRLEEALAKMKYMEQLGTRPSVHVYTALMIYYLKEKEINRALEILEEMEKRGCQPTIVTYSALICGYVRLGKVSDAWDVFESLKRNGPSPDFKTYSMFIDCLCKTGESEEAFKLVKEMMHDGIVPSTINFRNVIYGLNREGKSNLARVVLKEKLDLKRRRKMVNQ